MWCVLKSVITKMPNNTINLEVSEKSRIIVMFFLLQQNSLGNKYFRCKYKYKYQAVQQVYQLERQTR